MIRFRPCRSLLAVILVATLATSAQAQARLDPGEVHGLKLGLQARSMPLDGFGELACGSNGGAPRQKLEEWADFGKCWPEDNGLYEVYARFDDEDEYIGKAIEDPRYAAGRIGTRVAGHPVILSALFDRDGGLRGLRFVTDPLAAPHERRIAPRAAHGAPVAARGDQPLRAGWLDLHGFSAGRERNPGRRRVHQTALPESNAGAPPEPGHAVSAQAWPERQRSRHRRISPGR